MTFALLLGRSEGADPLTLDSAENALAVPAQPAVAGTASTDGSRCPCRYSRFPRFAPARNRGRTVGHPHWSPRIPWLYFYEDFLAAYDPDLREKAGAYYTPVEVVRAQVRLIDDLLVNRLSKPLGFADPGVVTLDPAVGTGHLFARRH